MNRHAVLSRKALWTYVLQGFLILEGAVMSEGIFDPIEDVIEAFRNGETIVMTDDEDRENEGDLVCAAEKITPEVINFMIKHARGLVCVPMDETQLARLGLAHMAPAYSKDKYYTAFMDSVDVREGATTGISAFDRANTVLALVNEKTQALREKGLWTYL